MVGRFVNLRTEIKPVATEQLLSTFLTVGKVLGREIATELNGASSDFQELKDSREYRSESGNLSSDCWGDGPKGSGKKLSFPNVCFVVSVK